MDQPFFATQSQRHEKSRVVIGSHAYLILRDLLRPWNRTCYLEFLTFLNLTKSKEHYYIEWFHNSSNAPCTGSLQVHACISEGIIPMIPVALRALGHYQSMLAFLKGSNSHMDPMARLAHKARGLLCHTAAPARSSSYNDSSSCSVPHCHSHTRGLMPIQ